MEQRVLLAADLTYLTRLWEQMRKDYETAADSYGRSGTGFEEAYQAAAAKRAKAERRPEL